MAFPMGDSLVNPVKPTSSGWYEVNLSDEKIKYLWKICNKSKTKENEMKHRLAGNITQSYNLEDEDNYFWKSVLYNLTDMYHRDNGGEHPHGAQKPEVIDVSALNNKNVKR